MKRGKKALWGGGYAGGSGEALSKLSVSHPFDAEPMLAVRAPTVR